MRLVQVMIPAGKREAVLGALDEEGIDYALTDETSGREYTAVVWFPLPTEAVEPILETLRETGIERDAYTVVVDAETVVSTRFEELEERYEQEEESEQRIAREELIARADDLAPRWPVFFAMTVISAVVATAGLLLDSPAVVVGSMVIAPLIGPAMATSVGSVVDDPDLFRRGVALQVAGFSTAIASAAAFAWLVKTIHLIPPGLDVLTIGQIRSRLSPDFLSLAVALGAGVAGAVSLASGVSAALVGVMIAAALIPPTAVIGIGIAWGAPRAVLSSTVLVLVNALSINLAALAYMWYAGYRPERWFRIDEARTATIKRVGILLSAIVLLSVFLGGVTYGSYQQATFEQTANDVAGDLTAAGGPYEQLVLIDLEVTYDEAVPFRNPTEVIVTVGRPGTNGYPSLAERIRQGIAERTGRSVRVQVRYVGIDSA
ncbi:MAG: TIGR00341 family protein [Haloferacaceae archaeon]